MMQYKMSGKHGTVIQSPFKVKPLPEPKVSTYRLPQHIWKPLFEDAVAIVRNELVKTLIKERANKSAKTLLDILSKRDKAHWDNSKSSTATVDLNKETNDIRVKFEVVGG